VSIVNEDWRWRMLTPPKGDISSVPVNTAGRRATEAWDYASEQTEANACKPFGVGGLTRVPGRLHVTWQDDRTLKLEFDAGTQRASCTSARRRPRPHPRGRVIRRRPGSSRAASRPTATGLRWPPPRGVALALVPKRRKVDRCA
jgi:hypothetical protein